MFEALREKVARARAMVEEYERLDARLAELGRRLAADTAGLRQLKDQLERQRRAVDAQGRAADAEVRRRPESPGAVLERIKQEKARMTLEAAHQELDALLARLSRFRVPAVAVPAAAQEQKAPPAAPPVVAAPAGSGAAAPAAPPAPVVEVAEEVRPPHAETEAPPAPAAGESAEAVEPHDGPAPGGPDADEQALREALDTGRRAMADLDRCAELVRQVGRGGAWQTVKSAVLPHSPGHATLAEALAAAREAKADVRRFREQTAALRQRFGETLDLGDVPTLADLFEDALAVAATDEGGLGLALGEFRKSYHGIRAACVRLQLGANRLRVRRVVAGRASSTAAPR